MMVVANEYRCTRRSVYSGPGCLGHKDPGARQGYYVVALTPEDALARMRVAFPDDADGFDIQVWKKNLMVHSSQLL